MTNLGQTFKKWRSRDAGQKGGRRITSRRIIGLLLCGAFLVPLALPMAPREALGDERPTDPDIGPSTIELLPYQAAGYRYHTMPQDETPPPGFEQPSFDDTGWPTGAAAFGSGGDCPLQATVQTPWPVESELVIRRVVTVPPGATDVRVMAIVDNDIMAVFFNGVPLSGVVAHNLCPIPDEFRFDVPHALVTPGDNLVAFHVRDREVAAFFDTRILAEAPAESVVTIDTKPGRRLNAINPKSTRVIPVAILTTDTFDATTVDPLSVVFGPSRATEAHGTGHIEDANGDGQPDLVLHFNTQASGIQCGDTFASLTGKTFDGNLIHGADAIRTIGCK